MLRNEHRRGVLLVSVLRSYTAAPLDAYDTGKSESVGPLVNQMLILEFGTQRFLG